jgi:hypothetical protein
MHRSSSILVLCLCALCAAAAEAQYAPRLSTGLEFGPELILADDRISLSAAFQSPVGSETDVRLAIGVEDPDVTSTNAVLSGGVRAFLSDVGPGRVLPAMQGQLDVFFGEGNAVRLTGGPSFGVATGVRQSLIPYVQPLFLYAHEDGRNDVKLGARLGADYAMKPRLDLRGDLVISSFLQLRAALMFEIGRGLTRRTPNRELRGA